jgi:hypothetical protein
MEATSHSAMHRHSRSDVLICVKRNSAAFATSWKKLCKAESKSTAKAPGAAPKTSQIIFPHHSKFCCSAQ